MAGNDTIAISRCTKDKPRMSAALHVDTKTVGDVILNDGPKVKVIICINCAHLWSVPTR